jgi:4-hydroxy-3-polyprenylbenzoate decarboxylase
MKTIVAITGASGVIVGLKLINELKNRNIDVSTIISDAGKKVLKEETKTKIETDYDEDDIAASIASSSNKVDALVVCPCSMKTLSAIANGYADNLITRLTDVQLKMKRKLILCIRETPYNLVHIENMRKVTLAGGIIMPLNIAYYFEPKSLNDVEKFFVGKILDLLDIDHDLYKRWKQ